MTTGQKIKKIRKEKGITQKELANRLSMSQQNLAQYENDKRNPKLETIRRIATALDVYMSDLMDGWDKYTPEEIADDLSKTSKEALESTKKIVDSVAKSIQASVENIRPAREELLLAHYNNLNSEGKTEAIRQVELLTEIPKYQKKD
jgi:transcriptional regulator with XRE-family HTH domain